MSEANLACLLSIKMSRFQFEKFPEYHYLKADISITVTKTAN